VLYDAVSLGNRYSTFRNTLLFSYSSFDNIKNISLHEGVCSGLYRNVDDKLPVDAMLLLSSKDTECSWSHPGCNWRSWGTHGAEGTE